MNNYLIPANTKKGQLILGLFKPMDMIIFGIGIFITVILIALLPLDTTWGAVLALAPALFTGLLVLPVAYYHNVRQYIIEIFSYLFSRTKYYWKGWCFLDESNDEYESKAESK